MTYIKPRTKPIDINWLVQQMEHNNPQIRDIDIQQLSTPFDFDKVYSNEVTGSVMLIDQTSINKVLESVLLFSISRTNGKKLYKSRQLKDIMLHRLFAAILSLLKINNVASTNSLMPLCRYLKLDYWYLRRAINSYKKQIYEKASKD